MRLAAIAIATLLFAILEGQAWAQACRTPDVSPIASEARRARWLIGDDARFQAMLDDERHRFRRAMETLQAEDRRFHIFAATAFSFQTSWPFDVCTDVGDKEASFERMRGAVTAGFTHADTGLHARVSFVGALDQLNIGLSDTNARAGAGQFLVAGRVGHERWLKLLVGYVGAEAPFAQRGTGDVDIRGNPRARTGAPSPGAFIGLVLPATHTSIVTVAQNGRTEIVSVLASDLRIGRLPFAFSLGPTYIREERQAVGLVRLRGISHEQLDPAKYDLHVEDNELHEGASTGHVTIGPVAEISTETRDINLRHGRFRVELEAFNAFASEKLRRSMYASLYAEGTFFRSRFFTEYFKNPEPRGTAWGLGTGLLVGVGFAPVFAGLDLHGAFNRPELLSLLPSAADRAEVRVGLMLRFEN